MLLLIFGPQRPQSQDIITKIVLAISSLVLDLFVFWLGLLTTKTDPSDRTVQLERYCRLTNQKFDDTDYQFYCNYCDTNVKEYSKHCGRCQRCTETFDHHCVWLNNCIGYNNYRYFFMLLIAVDLHSLSFIGLISWYYAETTLAMISCIGSDFTNLAYCSENFLEAMHVISIIMMATNSLIILLITYLLIYHIWLKLVGKTTYQHIVEQRKRQAEREEQRKAKMGGIGGADNSLKVTIGGKKVKGTPKMKRRKPKLSICG